MRTSQSELGRGSFRLGRWRVDPSVGELCSDGTVVRLRPKVMDLLAVFVRRPGEVLSKEALLDAVWPNVIVGDASLSVAVAELREALGDDPEAPSYLETIPRRGYRLIAAVSECSDRSRAKSRIWLTARSFEAVLAEGDTVLGRGGDAAVRIDSPKVSRRHCRISVTGDRAVVEDLGSKNGTYVNDRLITGPTSLVHGDQLRLGKLSVLLSVVVGDRLSTETELSRELPLEELADA